MNNNTGLMGIIAFLNNLWNLTLMIHARGEVYRLFKRKMPVK